MRVVSYHQNLFDLYGRELPVCAQALQMIEQCERRCGKRLPQSMREWYAFEGTVPLVGVRRWGSPDDPVSLWRQMSNSDYPTPLAMVLAEFEQGWTGAYGRHPGFVCILLENQGCARWYTEMDGSEDPPVWVDNDREDRAEWQKLAPFSDFLFNWFAHFGSPERFGLWLRQPREDALLPPYIDWLIDQFEEQPRKLREDGPTTYTFTVSGAMLRITTDHWDMVGGHSAWWLQGETPTALLSLAQQVRSLGVLHGELRADTGPGNAVLAGLK